MTLQHLGCRRLLLQRLGQIVGALLQLLEQPHVLDRDHCLVGEGLDELDLLVGEWPHLPCGRGMTPIGLPRACKGTPSTVRKPQALTRSCLGVFGSASTSANVNVRLQAWSPTRVLVPAGCGCSSRYSGKSASAVVSASAITIAVGLEDDRHSASQSRAADSSSVSSTGCKSKVERLMTLSTSAVAVCCCRLVAQFVEQPGVLDGDDSLVGKGRHQFDLLVGERRDDGGRGRSRRRIPLGERNTEPVR